MPRKSSDHLAAVPAGDNSARLAPPCFDKLPDSAFVRESQLVQRTNRPERTAPLPFSSATLWRMVKAKTFPAPVKLSERVTAWRVADVRGWLASLEVAA